MEEKNPFRVLSSREVYENPWIRVAEHQVIQPRGNAGIYGTVSFKNRAVGVIPFEDGHVWMVGQYRFPLKRYSWEIPEGGVPEGEDLLEGARRELREETGLTASKLELVLEMHLSNSVTDEYAAVYLAQGLELGEAAPDDTEELKLERVPLEQVYGDVVGGRITDAITVAAVLRIRLMQAEGKLG